MKNIYITGFQFHRTMTKDHYMVITFDMCLRRVVWNATEEERGRKGKRIKKRMLGR